MMGMPDEANDIGLMVKVRAGDARAFETLHARYQQQMRNFFYALSRNPSTANDLCQETFLRIWKVRKRYRASGAFPAYLFAIARMIWYEHGRAMKKTQRLGCRAEFEEADACPADKASRPDALAERSELQRHIQNALAELPEEQRMVFVLRTLEGLSLEDIAGALDCPINTVRSRKILAVKKLRHLLAKVLSPAIDTVS